MADNFSILGLLNLHLLLGLLDNGNDGLVSQGLVVRVRVSPVAGVSSIGVDVVVVIRLGVSIGIGVIGNDSGDDGLGLGDGENTVLHVLEGLHEISLGLGNFLGVGDVFGLGGQIGVETLLGHLERGLELFLGGLDIGSVFQRGAGDGADEKGDDLGRKIKKIFQSIFKLVTIINIKLKL